MNVMQAALGELGTLPGVRGALVLTDDGLPVVHHLHGTVPADTIAGLSSFLWLTIDRSLVAAGLGSCGRIELGTEAGAAVLVNLGQACLVVVLESAADLPRCRDAIDAAALRARNAAAMAVPN